MNNSNIHIGMLGAGISGLAAAHALKKAGFNITIHEKMSQPGGVIQTGHHQGWKTEIGPNTLLINSKEVSTFIDDLGLSDQLVEANPLAKKRFIVKNGSLVSIPLSFWEFLSSGLLSFRAKLRLLKEPFVKKGNDKESIAEFIIRRLGREPLYYGVNPFVSGVYAGDPQMLSIRHTFSSLYEMEQEHGSLLKGMITKRKKSSVKRSLVSFKEGIQQLPQKIASIIGDDLLRNSEISQINKNSDSWQVKTNNGMHYYDALVSTLPAPVLSNIWEVPEVIPLQDISYAPMSVLHLGFKREDIKHPLDGFGMLIPEVENHKLLGCLFSSTLFNNRAPENYVLLTCFLGGARNPSVAKKNKEELLQIAIPELKALLGLTGDPVFTRHTFWEHAIPQYELGYDTYLDAISLAEQNYSGLFIGGNFRGGVSVPDCITNGMKLADRIVTHFEA